MGEYTITGGQQVAVGDNARVENVTQNQIINAAAEIDDLNAFAGELSRLVDALRTRARSADEVRATGDVIEAEQAARSGNKQAVIQKLKSAGKWVLDVAEEVGTSVTAKVISHSLGLPD